MIFGEAQMLPFCPVGNSLVSPRGERPAPAREGFRCLPGRPELAHALAAPLAIASSRHRSAGAVLPEPGEAAGPAVLGRGLIVRGAIVGVEAVASFGVD